MTARGLQARNVRRSDKRIASFSRRLLGTLEARELTRLIVREGGELVGADGVALASLADGGVLVVSSLSNGTLGALAGQTLPLDGSLAGWCLRTGEPVMARDVARDPRAFSAAVAATGVRQLLVAPLAVGGERFGVMFAARSGRAPFRTRDLARWTRLAEEAALAISNARLYERAVARRRCFEELHEFAASVVGELDRQKVFDAVTRRAARMLGTDAASFLVSEDADVVYQSRFGPENYAPGFRLFAEDTIAGRVVREGRAVRISDISKDDRYNPDRMETGTQAVLAVPVWAEGAVLGSLGVLQYAARQFTDDDEEILRQLAAIAGSVLRQIAELTARREIEQRAAVADARGDRQRGTPCRPHRQGHAVVRASAARGCRRVRPPRLRGGRASVAPRLSPQRRHRSRDRAGRRRSPRIR